MTIKEHHRKQLESLYLRYGCSILKEIQYRLANYEPTRKICTDYSIALHEVRYLMTVDREITTFVYEKEHRQQLTLVYTKNLAA